MPWHFNRLLFQEVSNQMYVLIKLIGFCFVLLWTEGVGGEKQRGAGK